MVFVHRAATSFASVGTAPLLRLRSPCYIAIAQNQTFCAMGFNAITDQSPSRSEREIEARSVSYAARQHYARHSIPRHASQAGAWATTRAQARVAETPIVRTGFHAFTRSCRRLCRGRFQLVSVFARQAQAPSPHCVARPRTAPGSCAGRKVPAVVGIWVALREMRELNALRP